MDLNWRGESSTLNGAVPDGRRAPDLAGLLLAVLATGWAAGVPEQKLEAALKLQRRAQFRADFINAEDSTGFHAPQEAARILAEAIDIPSERLIDIVGIRRFPAGLQYTPNRLRWSRSVS